MKKIILILIISITTLNLFSQIKVGEWRDHFSFRDISFITESENEIIVASQNGLFFINKEDRTKNKLTKANGLSDIGISTVNYYSKKQLLFIGYDNGNIDIIIDNKITNIPDIKNKNISAGKEINSVIFIDNFAYLACGFGVLKLNIENFEVVETYYIGDESSLINVFEIVLFSDYFYVATEQGVYKAEVSNPNLIDFNNWKQIQDIPNFNKKFTSIVNFKNRLYTIYQNETTNRKNIYYYKNNSWQLFKENENWSATLFANTDKFIITTRNKISIYNENLLNVRNIEEYGEKDMNANRTLIDSENILWIADRYSGIVEENDDYTYNSTYVNGPENIEAYKIRSSNGKTIATMGGFHSGTGVNRWHNGTIYIFSENNWKNHTNYSARDYYAISFNPNDENNYFIGSWGNGVVEYQDDSIVEVYNIENSTLESVLANPEYVRVSSLYNDNNDNLWVSLRSTEHVIHVRKADKTWQTFEFDGLLNKKRTYNLIVTGNNNVWLTLGTNGLFAFDYNGTIENTSDDVFKKFYPKNEEGENLGQEIKIIAEDLDNNIWLGTNEGVGVIYNPTDFNEDGFYVNRVKITAELNDTLITNYLLKGEVINAIAVDGANRKWFGTENSGAYLVSENGTTELLHFTEKNSPLPSNKILSIAIDELSGEVFLLTDKGIVGYRAEATASADEFEDVYVFPNPVRETYTGIITVTGLVENTNVKITDIAGNIVYETDALGGQAIWDGNNFSGRRVQTGVYLIFCSNEDGTKTHVTKLLFIN